MALPLLSLLPIIGQLLPSLIPAFGTPVVGNILDKAGSIAERIFGTKDPSQIQVMIEKDKVLADQFKAQMEADTQVEQAFLADVASARTMQTEAVKSGSKVSWVPVLLTVAIFFLFGFAFYLSVMERIGTNNVAAQQIIGALIAAFATVIGFWFGSSRSSAQKDGVIAAVTNAAVQQNTDNAASQRMFR